MLSPASLIWCQTDPRAANWDFTAPGLLHRKHRTGNCVPGGVFLLLVEGYPGDSGWNTFFCNLHFHSSIDDAVQYKSPRNRNGKSVQYCY